MRDSFRRLIALAALALGCGGAASESAPDAVAKEPEQPELDAHAWTAQWRRLALPDRRYSDGGIARTPSGWLVVASAGPSNSYAYRSSDGVRWQHLTLTDHDAELWPRGVAYGNGRYVIVGYRLGGSSLVLTSSDAEHWHEGPPDPEGFGLDGVQFVGGRFFARELDVWSSADAESWAHTRLEDFFAPTGVAFEAGRYLLVGVGAPQLSSDGSLWRAAPIDCALFSACFTDEDGGTPINQYRSVFSAAGYFYLAQLRSPDGQNWQELKSPAPTGYLSGRLVRREYDGTLRAWTEGGTPEPIDVLPAPEVRLPSEGDIPDSLDYSWSDGLDCTSARCVLLGGELYLVP